MLWNYLLGKRNPFKKSIGGGGFCIFSYSFLFPLENFKTYNSFKEVLKLYCVEFPINYYFIL